MRETTYASCRFMESSTQRYRGTDLAGEGLCDFGPQTESSRSTSFERCLSEALEASCEFREQPLPTTEWHIARADDGMDVRDCIEHGAQHQAGAGRFGMHTEGLHEGSTHEVGSESEILGCKGKERKGGVKNTQPDHQLPVKWLDQQVALDRSTSVLWCLHKKSCMNADELAHAGRTS